MLSTSCFHTLNLAYSRGPGSENLADYKSKYFSRRDKSAKSTYFRKIPSDKHLFTECRVNPFQMKRKIEYFIIMKKSQEFLGFGG